ncbi:hypothetical protein [Leifsonia sp. A12D58]|uniref:hypothetical protein n=1 Tax=Leifsonia sp. A12D58 TaxID=3397674 RepID=UPI0039E1291D
MRSIHSVFTSQATTSDSPSPADTPLAPLLFGVGGLLITGIAVGAMVVARKRSV